MADEEQHSWKRVLDSCQTRQDSTGRCAMVSWCRRRGPMLRMDRFNCQKRQWHNTPAFRTEKQERPMDRTQQGTLQTARETRSDDRTRPCRLPRPECGIYSRSWNNPCFQGQSSSFKELQNVSGTLSACQAWQHPEEQGMQAAVWQQVTETHRSKQARWNDRRLARLREAAWLLDLLFCILEGRLLPVSGRRHAHWSGEHSYEMRQIVEAHHIADFRHAFLRVFQQLTRSIQTVPGDILRECHTFAPLEIGTERRAVHAHFRRDII